MISINAGKLSRKISFFNNTIPSDGAGGFDNVTENLILETFASIKQIKATRVAENLQESINEVFEIKLRQRAGFNPQSNYTVKWDSKVCLITEIVDLTEALGLKKEWIITVVNRGAGL